MRDDFPVAVKDLLAKRVGFLCSNPGCRQPTSGPQEHPLGTVNVGVAAHLTGASSAGPRHDSTLTPEERKFATNGIWLCQICGKLVDNDKSRYTVEKLREWKSNADADAARALENRRSPATGTDGGFLEAERLMPELIAQMRADVRGDPTELVREFGILYSRNVTFGNDRQRFFYYETDHQRIRLQVDLLEEMGLVVEITRNNVPLYRMVPEFIHALRMPAIGALP